MRRTALMFVLAGLVGALVATPIAVYASHQFSDVPDSNPFHDDISWLADAEVTLGCGPNVFCPRDFVTREQMAAFMRRLAENRVVDADTVDGLDSSQLTGSGAAIPIETVSFEFMVTNGEAQAGTVLDCPDGYTVLGGGGKLVITNSVWVMHTSTPFESPTGVEGWEARWYTADGQSSEGTSLFVIEAVCADLG